MSIFSIPLTAVLWLFYALYICLAFSSMSMCFLITVSFFARGFSWHVCWNSSLKVANTAATFSLTNFSRHYVPSRFVLNVLFLSQCVSILIWLSQVVVGPSSFIIWFSGPFTGYKKFIWRPFLLCFVFPFLFTTVQTSGELRGIPWSFVPIGDRCGNIWCQCTSVKQELDAVFYCRRTKGLVEFL